MIEEEKMIYCCFKNQRCELKCPLWNKNIKGCEFLSMNQNLYAIRSVLEREFGKLEQDKEGRYIKEKREEDKK